MEQMKIVDVAKLWDIDFSFSEKSTEDFSVHQDPDGPSTKHMQIEDTLDIDKGSDVSVASNSKVDLEN